MITSLADYREAARQGAIAHIFISIPSRDLSSCPHLSSLASNRLRHASVEECIFTAGGFWTARWLSGDAAVANLGEIWTHSSLY